MPPKAKKAAPVVASKKFEKKERPKRAKTVSPFWVEEVPSYLRSTTSAANRGTSQSPTAECAPLSVSGIPRAALPGQHNNFDGVPLASVVEEELPDMTAWKAPKVKKEKVIERMQVRHALAVKKRFGSPRGSVTLPKLKDDDDGVASVSTVGNRSLASVTASIVAGTTSQSFVSVPERKRREEEAREQRKVQRERKRLATLLPLQKPKKKFGHDVHTPTLAKVSRKTILAGELPGLLPPIGDTSGGSHLGTARNSNVSGKDVQHRPTAKVIVPSRRESDVENEVTVFAGGESFDPMAGSMDRPEDRHGTLYANPSSPFRRHTRIYDDSLHPGPSNRRQQRHLQRLEQQNRDAVEYAKEEIREFDDVCDERKAFADFVRNSKVRTLPNMVIKAFRHQISVTSALAIRIRNEVRIGDIESEVLPMGNRVLRFNSFVAMLMRLLKAEPQSGRSTPPPNDLHEMQRRAPFTIPDAQALFDFFDTDSDGDVDYKELCIGFTMILSKDGTRVPVMHRCHTLVNPGSIKDTRLSFMSRFELQLMADTILEVCDLSDADYDAAAKDLDECVNAFGCNRRGMFPFDEMREFVGRHPAIRKAILSFTVPREPELHKSQLSVHFREYDAEEGESSFTNMRSKSKRSDMSPLQKAALMRAQQQDQANGGLESTVGDYDMESLSPMTPQTAALSPGEGMTPTAGWSPGFKREKSMDEPGCPSFYTLRGVLYRQDEGKEPVPVNAPGMPAKVLYSYEDRRRPPPLPVQK